MWGNRGGRIDNFSSPVAGADIITHADVKLFLAFRFFVVYYGYVLPLHQAVQRNLIDSDISLETLGTVHNELLQGNGRFGV